LALGSTTGVGIYIAVEFEKVETRYRVFEEKFKASEEKFIATDRVFEEKFIASDRRNIYHTVHFDVSHGTSLF
jgi:hypothetical protein